MLVLGVAFAVLRIKFEGPGLADKVASILNKRMRGRIEIGSIEWPTSALKAAVAGGWIPVTVHDVRVWDDCALSAAIPQGDPDEIRKGDPNEDCTPDDRPDPDPKSKRQPRKLLLSTPLITGEIDAHAAMFGNHNLVVRNLWVHGGEALLEQTREPQPLHAYDRTIVSIVTAFYPRLKAGFRAGLFADTAPPIFDLRDIHIENLDLSVHVAPQNNSDGSMTYGMTARIDGVNVDAGADAATPCGGKHECASLYMDGTDPLVAKFYVNLALTGRHGIIRVLDKGPRQSFRIAAENPDRQKRHAQYQIELADIRLDRLAQLPTEWARHNFVANTLELDGTLHTIACASEDGVPAPTTDGAEIHIGGELLNYWDRPYDGEWALALETKNLGPTLRTCINHKLGGDNLAGTIALSGPFIAQPKVRLDLHDLDFDLPLRRGQDPLRLTLAEVHGEIDLVNEHGSIEKTKALVRNGKEPGEVEVSADFDLRPYRATASVDITKPIDVGRFLPVTLATSVGRFLSGKLTADGDVDTGFALRDFDLALGDTPADKVVRVHASGTGQIFTGDAFDTIQIRRVMVDAGQTHAQFDGAVFIAKNDMRVHWSGEAPDLKVWLKRFGLPEFAQSAGGGGDLTGPITSPRITVTTELSGIPCIDKMKVQDAEYANGIVTIKQLSTEGLGGAMTATGVIHVANGQAMIEKLHMSGTGLRGEKLCGLGGDRLKGTIDTAEIDVRGTVDKSRSVVDWLDHIKLRATAKKLNVYGDGYSDVAVCVNRDDDATCRMRTTDVSATDLSQCTSAKQRGGSCAVASAKRDDGGTLDVTLAKLPATIVGKRATPATLAGAIALDAVPLAVLDQLVGADTVGGMLSAQLHVSGSADAKGAFNPQLAGTLGVTGGRALDAFIGDAVLSLDPVTVRGVPGIELRGKLLADRLDVTARIGTRAPYPVELVVNARRVEVDPFVDIAKKLGISETVQGWASGRVTLTTELAPLSGKPAQPEAWVELSELSVMVNHRARDGRLTQLAVELVDQGPDRPAMSLHLTKSSLVLACRDGKSLAGSPCDAKLRTPAGDVVVSGQATAAGIAFNANGNLDLHRLAGMLDNQFDDVRGGLVVTAGISGPLSNPSYQVTADLDALQLRPVGSDTVVQVCRRLIDPDHPDATELVRDPDCQIKLANGSLGFNNLKLSVKDERSYQEGELVIHGGIGLDGLRPKSWGVFIEGTIAGKMLLAAMPSQFSQASGIASIDGELVLSGTGLLPLLDGAISFSPPKPGDPPLAVTARGFRHELELRDGRVEVRTTAVGDHREYTLTIGCGLDADSDCDDHVDIKAAIDGEGSIRDLHGSMTLRDGLPTRAHVELDADEIPYRVPGALDLQLSARDITLDLPDDHSPIRVRGAISVVNGRYLRDIQVTDALKLAPTTAAPAGGLVTTAFGGADLLLSLDIRRFSVVNNLGTIDLEGTSIQIKGSPRDPRLNGSIRVSRGDFKIPGTRAHFTRTTGSIDFAENMRADNPRLDLTADDPAFTDLSGQQHIITLTVTGTLEELQWDLRTSTGYNKSQTLSLLLLGRNPEQLRRSLGDQSLGSNPTLIDPTTNPSTGFADEIVKDLAGDWVSGLVGQSVQKILPLDVLRFELGFGTVGVYAEKKALDSIKFIGRAEQTIRGTSLSIQGELQSTLHIKPDWSDSPRVTAGLLQKNYYDPSEIDITDLHASLAYRLFIP